MPLHEPSEDSFCHNCSKIGNTLRCSKCKRARYCSRECQKSHWKAGHKKTCGISVEDALLQLHKLGLNMSLSESIEGYHRATDAVHSQSKLQSNTNSNSSHKIVNKALDESKVKMDAPEPQIVTKGDWNFIIENLSNISTHIVMMVSPSMNSVMQLDDIQLNIVPLKQNTKVTVSSRTNGCLAEFMLPKLVCSTTDEVYQTLQMHQDQKISFRIRYEDLLHDPNDTIVAPCQSTPNTAINHLKCKSCGVNLVRSYNDKEKEPLPMIQNVYPLPSGHWDEITDYLTCFEGQATVDFSSANTTATKGIALEDEVILVMNMEDLTNVCVLAVDGLGEQVSSISHPDDPQDSDSNPVKDLAKDHISYRGQREWKDAVGGAALCCSNCCINIGSVSLTEGQTCRLYKHRLSSFSSEGKDYFINTTCGTFVAKELVRYLENHAIFTFAIYGRVDGKSSDSYDCIVLKVLSWNTMMATKELGEMLRFQKTVKVLYEVIDLDKIPKHQNTASELDPMSFTWGGACFCCPTNNSQTQLNNSWQGNEQTSSSNVAKGNVDKMSKNQNTASELDPMSFTWGGACVCCPTNKSQTKEQTSSPNESEGNVNNKRASVSMYLYGDDWLDLKHCLENGSAFFSREMSKATAALKFGPADTTKNNATLSFLQL